MRKADKEQADEIVRLLGQVHEGIRKMLETGQKGTVLDLLSQCQDAAIQLGETIERSEGEGFVTVTLLEEYCELVYQIYESVRQGENIPAGKTYKNLHRSLILIRNSLNQDVTIRQEAVFLPYKASMWDSLESVWKAADEDPKCNAYVIPIPYYDRNPDGSFKEEHYEGDLYPPYVPITWYKDYDFQERRPDFIFIHNPYDECNYLTSVHPYFYSKNLKLFTDQLIYIPYFILNEIDPNNQAAVDGMAHFCTTPGVLYADKTIVQSENMRQVYIKALTEFTKNTSATRSYWEEKILGLGSPKIDKVLNTRKEDVELPKEWLSIIERPDGSWKKIIFYNIGVTAILQNGEKMIAKIKDVFDVFKENKEKVALLWRPHPLVKATFQTMRPQLWAAYKELLDQYLEEGWGIYDDTPDLDRAIVVCDGYYGDPSSVVQLCQAAGKPVLIQDVNVVSSNENILLSTYNMVRSGEEIYFASKNVAGFFTFHTQTKRTKQIAIDVLTECGTCSKFMFGGICVYKEKVVFAPYESSKILIYSNDEEKKMVDINQIFYKEGQKNYYVKRAVVFQNLIYFICNKYSEMLCLNMDTLQIHILNFWKKDSFINAESTEFIGVNTGGDVCVVDESFWVPLNCNNCILEVDMRTQEVNIHKINGQEMRFSTICFDGIYFWLTGYEPVVVRWNHTNNFAETFHDFPEGFQKFHKEDYWEELFTRSFYDNGYVYLFPMTVNMALKIKCETGQMEKIYQWSMLESCYTVEKWDDDIFYIETGNDNYIDIDDSMLMDRNGTVLKHNIFKVLSENIEYHFNEKGMPNYIETQACTLEKILFGI